MSVIVVLGGLGLDSAFQTALHIMVYGYGVLIFSSLIVVALIVGLRKLLVRRAEKAD